MWIDCSNVELLYPDCVIFAPSSSPSPPPSPSPTRIGLHVHSASTVASSSIEGGSVSGSISGSCSGSACSGSIGGSGESLGSISGSTTNGSPIVSAELLLQGTKRPATHVPQPGSHAFPVPTIPPPVQISHRTATSHHGSFRVSPASPLPSPTLKPTVPDSVIPVRSTTSPSPPPIRSALSLVSIAQSQPPTNTSQPTILSAAVLKTTSSPQITSIPPPAETASPSPPWKAGTSAPNTSPNLRQSRHSASTASLLSLGSTSPNLPPHRTSHLNVSPSPSIRPRNTSSPSPGSPPPILANLPWFQLLAPLQRVQVTLMLSVRKKVADELLTTEVAYLEKLNIITSLVYYPLCKDSSFNLNPREMLALFSNVNLLRSYHKRFKKAVERRIRSWNESTTIGDLFLETKWLIFYKHFANNFNEMRSTIQTCKQYQPNFATFLEALEFQEKFQFNNLEGLMISLIQRIPRYILLIEEFTKNTPVTHPDHPLLELALQQLREAAEYTNQQQRTPHTQTQLWNLENTISGLPIQLTSPPSDIVGGENSVIPSGWRGIGGVPRAVLHSGELKVEGKKSNIWLLTDLLLVAASSTRNGKLNLHHIFSLPSTSLDPLTSSSTTASSGKKTKSFNLTTLTGIITFKASSVEDADVWVQKIQSATTKSKAALLTSTSNNKVRDSGNTSDMRSRLVALNSLQSSESQYIKNLEFTYEVLLSRPLGAMNAHRRKEILCNFVMIIKEHQMFLEHIDQSIQSWDDDLYIDVFPSIPARFKKLYKEYFADLSSLTDIIQSAQYLDNIPELTSENSPSQPQVEMVKSWLEIPLKRLLEYYRISHAMFEHISPKSLDYHPLHGVISTLHAFINKIRTAYTTTLTTPIPPPPIIAPLSSAVSCYTTRALTSPYTAKSTTPNIRTTTNKFNHSITIAASGFPHSQAIILPDSSSAVTVTITANNTINPKNSNSSAISTHQPAAHHPTSPSSAISLIIIVTTH
ncbi:rho guanine nucleotide exchange factor 17 [Pelomyxa schiedti]|nr:rho guanine nucleotide exchange factor 17 [Pelomyxa schiedti]